MDACGSLKVRRQGHRTTCHLAVKAVLRESMGCTTAGRQQVLGIIGRTLHRDDILAGSCYTLHAEDLLCRQVQQPRRAAQVLLLCAATKP